MTEEESYITWEDVKHTAMEEAESLEEYPVGLQKRIIYMATLKTPYAKYKSFSHEMRCLLAAHMAVKRKIQPAGEGTISSSSIGSVSVTNTMEVNNPTARESLLSTSYGREYYEYKKNLRTLII